MPFRAKKIVPWVMVLLALAFAASQDFWWSDGEDVQAQLSRLRSEREGLDKRVSELEMAHGQLLRASQPSRPLFRLDPLAGYKDVSAKQRLPREAVRPGAAVILALGQSNLANNEGGRYLARTGVFNFNFFDGGLYSAHDPLLGCSDEHGGVLARLGDKLVEQEVFPQVVLIPLAVSGSSIRHWMEEGGLFPRVERAKRLLDEQGLAITHVLWHQGEADADDRFAGAMPRHQYLVRFLMLMQRLRVMGIEAPVFVAVASICGNQGSDEIRTAQRLLPQIMPDIIQGPDTDNLSGEEYRVGGCHLNDAGLDLHAQMWVNILASQRAR